MLDNSAGQLENGKPNRVRVPQGELMLMYLPQVPPANLLAPPPLQIRNPNGGAAVELSHSHLQRILAETSHPTSMVMLPTGGLLLMSLSPYNDTDAGYRVAGPASDQPATLQGPLSQDLNTVARHQQEEIKVLPTLPLIRGRTPTTTTAITTTTKAAPSNLATTTTSTASPAFQYPAEWKNKIPKFPYVPPPRQHTTKEVEEDPMPVFPHSPRRPPSPPPLRMNITWPHTTSATTRWTSTPLLA